MAYRQRLRELLRVGRTSLVIGLLALAAAIAVGDFLAALMKGSRIGEILRESLTIGGWVSMWRPLEIFLYDRWPIRNEAQLSRSPCSHAGAHQVCEFCRSGGLESGLASGIAERRAGEQRRPTGTYQAG